MPYTISAFAFLNADICAEKSVVVHHESSRIDDLKAPRFENRRYPCHADRRRRCPRHRSPNSRPTTLLVGSRLNMSAMTCDMASAPQKK